MCVFVCCISFLQLQEEKEKQFHEHRATLDELARSKDHEIQSLLTRVQKMTQEMEASKLVRHEAIKMEDDTCFNNWVFMYVQS